MHDTHRYDTKPKADLVQQSFALKAKNKRLLATAKRVVEIAIETDEQTAMAYINDHTGELNHDNV